LSFTLKGFVRLHQLGFLRPRPAPGAQLLQYAGYSKYTGIELMFYSLLLATFVVAALVSLLVVKLFDKPIGLILERIIQDKISSAWRRYITFAAFVAGISGGVRIYALERYIEPEKENVAPLVLNGERWTLEIYRTVIECLQSIA